MAIDGAGLAVKTLASEGVKSIFCLSGNQVLPVLDATVGSDIQIVHTRHEAAAVHMADAWGRLTARPGIALLTAGPGHLGGLSALYTALMAESPVLLLSGQSAAAQSGRGAFQEVDQIEAARSVTKAAWAVDNPGQIAADISRALRIACSGRPGPVHLSLPVDILEAAAAFESDKPAFSPTDSDVPGPEHGDVQPAAIDEALALLDKAKKPLILTGPAMSRGESFDAVKNFAKEAQIYALPMISPRGVNDPALLGLTDLIPEADVVLLLGKRLDFSLRFGGPSVFSRSCRIIRSDAEVGQNQSGREIELEIAGAPLSCIGQMLAGLQKQPWQKNPGRSGWYQAVRATRNTTPQEWLLP